MQADDRLRNLADLGGEVESALLAASQMDAALWILFAAAAYVQGKALLAHCFLTSPTFGVHSIVIERMAVCPIRMHPRLPSWVALRRH